MNRREQTIKYSVPNLRYRWKKELSKYSDNAVAACYEDFYFSEDYGNNDEKFPTWFELLPEYEAEREI